MNRYLLEADDLFSKIAPWCGTVPVGYVPNYLGVMTAVLFHAHWYPREDIVEVFKGPYQISTKVPSITDGEYYLEQSNVLRSVLSARDKYTMVELGGGIGARAVDCAIALRQLNPQDCFLVVVEALPVYIDWCKHHFCANDLDPDKHWLLNGIVSDRPLPEMMYLQPLGFGNQIGGFQCQISDMSISKLLKKSIRNKQKALKFIRYLCTSGSVAIEHGKVLKDNTWKDQINVSDQSKMKIDQFLSTSVIKSEKAKIGFVSAYTLQNILLPLEKVDLMDVDIQYAEIKVIPPNLGLLKKKVKLLNIGSHSVAIHNQLLKLFEEAEWEIIYNYAPWTEHNTDLGIFKTNDGVLSVRNNSI